MMNKTEQIAFEWLKKEKNITDDDIIVNSNKSPDFICSDGERYEVKKLYGRNVLFYSSQVDQLLDTDTILVFGDNGKLFCRFLWGERDTIDRILIKNINVQTTKPVRLNADTILRLKDAKLTKRESYDEIVNRILDTIDDDYSFPETDKPLSELVPRVKVKTGDKLKVILDAENKTTDKDWNIPIYRNECPTCGGTVWELGTDGKKCRGCGEIVKTEE